MPTKVQVQVTQTQEENDNPTMAHPVLNTSLDPRIPKKFLQSKFSWTKTVNAPVPEPDFIQVPGHLRGSSKVRAYKKYTTPAKSHGNKEKGRAIKSKTKTGEAKQGAFPKLEDGYKNMGDAQTARSLHLEQKMKLARGIK